MSEATFPATIDAREHYRQRFERARRGNSGLVGAICGAIAMYLALLVWEQLTSVDA